MERRGSSAQRLASCSLGLKVRGRVGDKTWRHGRHQGGLALGRLGQTMDTKKVGMISSSAVSDVPAVNGDSRQGSIALYD